MTAFLGYVPIFASFVLGILYLWAGDGGTATKATGAAVFLTAAYLQFFSPYLVAGVLLQVALAFTLEMWRRMM
ncbi:MAG TPA: hypothetical protein VMZ90_14355 [Vicinamibacterales bacterium]|nr:hypothetical protein [Vicinamibacterales bacterium]